MEYQSIKEGVFLSRPNRFIARVEIDGKEHICHVKNTGRCRELLIKGTRVILSHSPSPSRKTEYDLIAVYKDDRLINIDSQSPNKVIEEWIRQGGFFGTPSLVKPEYTYGNSRFDFYIEAEGRKILAEVKGVTLERDGVLLFPDAPTVRGVKHINELREAVKKGYEAYVIFVIQMEDCLYFTPNADTHPEFATALRKAAQEGVRVIALTCKVFENSMQIKEAATVKL